MNGSRLLLLGMLAAAATAVQLRAAEPEAARPGRQPEAKAGPYRVALDRINQNSQLSVSYQTPNGHRSGNLVDARRSVHLQLGVFTEDVHAKAGLSVLQIKNVTAEGNGRVQDLPHYGGILESANDNAAVRAYLYVPSFPPLAGEIRSIEGEIIAYDNTAPLALEIPVSGKVPITVEKGGVRATVREFAVEGDTARAVIWVEGPAQGAVLNTTNDGSYGVSLVNTDGQSAASSGGALLQPRANQAEYRVGFQNVKGTTAKLRVDLLNRAGPKRVYPFRIEHVPLARGKSAPPGDPPGGGNPPK